MLQTLLFNVKFSVSWSCTMSYLNSSRYLFNIPLHLCIPTISNLSHLLHISAYQLYLISCTSLSRKFAHLLFVYPNHLNFFFLILSTIEATHTLSWIFSFLILSLILSLYIYLSILIFATCILWIWKFVTSLHSVSYNNVDLIITL